MGAASSSEPRSVSMENPFSSGVIDVSDDVIRRLRKDIAQQASSQKRGESVSTSKPTSQRPTTPPPRSTPTMADNSQRAQPSVIYPTAVNDNTMPSLAKKNLAQTPTLTALEMKRMKEDEMRQNDAAWRKRMHELEESLRKTDDLMEKEFSVALEKVRHYFATSSDNYQPPPCQELKGEVMSCYSANPGQTLKCSDTVEKFRHCVAINCVKRLDGEIAGNNGKPNLELVPINQTTVKPIKAS